MAEQQNLRRRRRRGHRGGGQRRRQTGQGEQDNPPPTEPPATRPAQPEQDPDPLPSTCYIERTNDMDQSETVLEYLAVYVQIVGTRPPVTTVDTLRAIAAHFHLDAGTLEL